MATVSDQSRRRSNDGEGKQLSAQSAGASGGGDHGRKSRSMTPEQVAAVEKWLEELNDVLESRGAHAGHTLQQVGRCVYCSCGYRFQGRLQK